MAADDQSSVPAAPASAIDQKLKYLDHIQATIARMAGNSFAFKGWNITVASGIAAFAAVEAERALLVIVALTTLLFWALDGYYLWLERGFVNLHNAAAQLGPNDPVSFDMRVDKTRAFRRWLATCRRPHLLAFYGAILIVDVLAIIFFKEVK